MVADVWGADARGMAMNVFSFAVYFGQALGSVIFGEFRGLLPEIGTHACYRLGGAILRISMDCLECVSSFFLRIAAHDVSIVNMMICGVQAIIVYVVFVETRGPEILERRARMLTTRTGVLHLAHIDGGSENPTQSLYKEIKTSVVRPAYYLVTEPIVFAMAMWVGLL